MNIALLGFGKMGREIERLAVERGLHVIARKSRSVNEAAEFHKADVLIDFSAADGVTDHIQLAIELQKPIVVGTTGWLTDEASIRRAVERGGIGVVYASNFSIGVQLFSRLVQTAGELFDRFDEYDAYLHEMHHRQKIDSPSGTAITLSEILLKALTRKKHALTQNADGRIAHEALHVTSTRAGYIPGTHIVAFDSESDTIELKHTARNRSGFAAGALVAAHWIRDRKGFFSIHDMMNERLARSL